MTADQGWLKEGSYSVEMKLIASLQCPEWIKSIYMMKMRQVLIAFHIFKDSEWFYHVSVATINEYQVGRC